MCFFSSYDYEEKVHAHWQETGILDKMNARKKVGYDMIFIPIKGSNFACYIAFPFAIETNIFRIKLIQCKILF